jgi:hypothetical protein
LFIIQVIWTTVIVIDVGTSFMLVSVTFQLLKCLGNFQNDYYTILVDFVKNQFLVYLVLK